MSVFLMPDKDRVNVRSPLRRFYLRPSQGFLLNIAVGAFLFLVAFLPRAFGLDVFVTPDEYLWIERSGRFLAALLRADWAATFQVGHPGLTTRWTGVLGILATYLPRLHRVSGRWLVDGQPFPDRSG